MGQAQYDVYISDVISLAQSMVIKSELQAQAINAYLTQLYNASGNLIYSVNDADPTTWKYYLNINGQYHPADTMMQVISQDSLQTIDFTVENLQTNTATAAAYAVGGRYYNELVGQYPTQSQLIRGIVNPVNITTAITAADGSVLWMDPTLVESNEMNLAMEISRWVRQFFVRWNTPAYSLVDDLYTASMLGVMYCMLPLAVLRVRMKNCHTYMANSFHIGEYLEGQGGLNKYVSSMTKPQMLWLYRNVRYVQRNAGKQSTFQWLIQNILTARNLPLSSWDMRHNTQSLQQDLVATPTFTRTSLNNLLSEGGVDTRDVSAMLQVELPMARDNSAGVNTVGLITEELALSLDDNLDTKVLESSVLDLTDATVYRLSDCLLNHWIYFAATGRYIAYISVEDPRTGDFYNFTAKDAFIVYMYVLAGSIELPLTEIPTIYAQKVRKVPTPPPSEIQPYLTSAVTANDIAAAYQKQPVIARSYISIDSFNAAVTAIHQGELWQYALFSTQGDMWTRAELEFATLYQWTNYLCDFGIGENYAMWFSSRNLDIPSLTPAQMGEMATAIVATATGINSTATESLANIQAAMLGIMKQLSSYSVQYIASINTTPLIEMAYPTIRQNTPAVDGKEEALVIMPHATILDSSGAGAAEYDGLVPLDLTSYKEDGSASATFATNDIVEVFLRPLSDVFIMVPLPRATLLRVTDNLDFSFPIEPITILDEYQPGSYKSLPEAFASTTLGFYQPLSSADEQTIYQRYTSYIAATGTPTGLLSAFITSTSLTALYPGQ